MDIELSEKIQEEILSKKMNVETPGSVDSNFDPLKQFSNAELAQMIMKSKATSKKLCMREYQISKELDGLGRNIDENEAILKRLKSNKEDSQSNAEELKKKEIRALLYNIQNYEKKIIKLEKEALDKNTSSKSPFLEELNKEFSEKGYAEKDRNRELGLYVKQDYANTKTTEIEKLKDTIGASREEMNGTFEKIRELEQRQINYCESISALRRIKMEEEEKGKDLGKKIEDLKSAKK